MSKFTKTVRYPDGKQSTQTVETTDPATRVQLLASGFTEKPATQPDTAEVYTQGSAVPVRTDTLPDEAHAGEADADGEEVVDDPPPAPASHTSRTRAAEGSARRPKSKK